MSHYFTNDQELKHRDINLEYTFNNELFKFKSDSGVFSKNELDYGSISLLKVLVKEPIEGKVLDLGCGYGTIGIILKKFNNDLSIDMVDINERAIILAKKKCIINNTNNEVILSDGLNGISRRYNCIITNPPIRAGKQVIYKMMDDSYNNLDKNGSMYVVVRKSQGAKSFMEKLHKLFGNCELLKKDKGFYIIKSIKDIDN